MANVYDRPLRDPAMRVQLVRQVFSPNALLPTVQATTRKLQKRLAVATVKIIGIIRRTSTERSTMHLCVNPVPIWPKNSCGAAVVLEQATEPLLTPNCGDLSYWLSGK
jgi:hypothetical protein